MKDFLKVLLASFVGTILNIRIHRDRDTCRHRIIQFFRGADYCKGEHIASRF
jgi:hypothetical protein